MSHVVSIDFCQTQYGIGLGKKRTWAHKECPENDEHALFEMYKILWISEVIFSTTKIILGYQKLQYYISNRCVHLFQDTLYFLPLVIVGAIMQYCSESDPWNIMNFVTRNIKDQNLYYNIWMSIIPSENLLVNRRFSQNFVHTFVSHQKCPSNRGSLKMKCLSVSHCLFVDVFGG